MADDPYKYFRVEARELSSQLQAGILQLEKADADSGIVTRLFRAAHTLKSSAGNVGAVRLGRACAALEEQAHGGIAASVLVQRVLQEYEHTVTELSRILEEMDP